MDESAGSSPAPVLRIVPASVDWTVSEAAQHWRCSISLVRKWIKQERIKFTRIGDEIRVNSPIAPSRAPRGTLSDEQRGAWPKGGKPNGRRRA